MRALNYSDANHTLLLLGYISAALALCMLVNPLHDLLYDRTLDHIRWLNPKKSPITNQVMYTFSDIGEADNLYFIIVVIWLLNFNSKTLT